MISKNIKIYCNDEPILTLCNIYDNNTPISIEKLNSLASFEVMHNTKTDAHKNLFDEIKNMISEQGNNINLKANIDDLPTKVSELENDMNYLIEHQDISNKASIDLDNLTVEGLKKLEYRKASKLTNFTANSGNINKNNEADLFSCDGNTLSFKVGGDYQELYVTNAQGESYKKEILNDIVFSAEPYTTTGNYINIAKNDGFKAFTGCGDCTNAILNGGEILLRGYKGYQPIYLELLGDTPFKLKKWSFANRDNQSDNGYAPTYWTLQASNNNVDWDILTSKVCSATKYQGSVKWEWDINSVTGYKYYKFIGSGMTGGTNETGQSISSISFIAEYDYVTSNDDGVYNIMVPKNGEAYAIQNKIIKQNSAPSANHNYTIIGLPTITDDGIFTKVTTDTADRSNYVKLPFDNTSIDWKIEFDFYFGSGASRLIGDPNISGLQIYFSKYGMSTNIYGTESVVIPKPLDAIHPTGNYKGYLEYKNGVYTIGYIYENWDNYRTSSVESNILPSRNTLSILYQLEANSEFKVDLSNFCIISNGNETFRGITHDKYIWLNTSCEPLKAYRNDGKGLVECEDVPIGKITLEGAQITKFEVYPYANIQIDTPNNVIPANIIDSSDKSLMPSWYRVYSDGWCEQGGVISGDGTTSLLKSFIDINYTITLASLGSEGVPRISGKDVSSFSYSSARTANTPANWIAKGYIK